MNSYEALLDIACANGLIVKEKDLQSSNGRIKGNRIAIRKSIETTNEKACVLAEEMGHFETTVGDILDQSNAWNRKQERQSRLRGYNRRIGLLGLIRAYEYGCSNQYEIAEYLEITEEFLCEAIECYRDKYGVYTCIDNYTIYFIPNLVVMKRI